jgi:pantetheine-phosphate adenylyltransferase
MMKIALFPGSFDPLTKGHVEIITKGLSVFDKVIVAIGRNSQKKYLFDIEIRKQWIEDVFKDFPAVEVMIYEGLTIDFCQKIGANYLLRGLRSCSDFEYEKGIAFANKEMNPQIETVFLLSSPATFNISSTIVRDIIVNKGDYSHFVPKEIKF